jgi:aldehyde dehydrogenase (NAD+)
MEQQSAEIMGAARGFGSELNETEPAGGRPYWEHPYEGFDELLMGGTWRKGSSGKVAADQDPYTGETLVEITLASAGDVDFAYKSAQKTQPAWAAVRPQERRNLFARAAHIVEKRRSEILDWLVRESGSTIIKAQFEWQLVHLGMLEAAGYSFHAEGKLLPSSVKGKESRVHRRPVGVVGIISPWNFPMHLTNRALAPALAAGNCVVIKPASDTPVTGGLLLAKIYEEAGLPDEVLHVLVGEGNEIGNAMVDHPIPRVISFTGSTATGRRIAEHAARGVKRMCLELGGNTPFIVLEDADIGRAVAAAVTGKFLHQGQICMAINRILVAASRYDEFLDAFVQRTRGLKAGNPAETDTAIGPIINQSQLDSITRKVDATVERGARVVLRGDPAGLVLPPVVLADVTNDMPAAKEEVFGPVASLLRFQDEEEAIRIANDTEYGLSAAVFARDLERGVRVAKRIQAGMVHVNDMPINDEPNTAFGGEKASGIGRYGGEWALEEFTTHQWISVQEVPRKYPL